MFLHHSNELAGAALRFGHSLVGQRVFRVDDRKSVNEYDLQTNFFNNTMVYTQGWLIYGFIQIGHFNEYSTSHYFGNPTHPQSMIAYMILTWYFWNFQ